MLPWFLRNPERLKLERTGIEKLSSSTNWLIGTEWHLDNELCLDAVICAHNHEYEVRITFPPLFPDAPIVVRPQNMKHRISTHQYGGPDGPLCLEWGPDNWHRDITAVQMLESTYRLLDIENPLGEDRPDISEAAPSRHELTMGQELRSKWARWYASNALFGYFSIQPMYSVGTFKFSFREVNKKWIGLVHESMLFGGSVWKDDQIPILLGAGILKVGIWFKTDLEKKTIGQPKKLADLRDLLADMPEAKFLTFDGSSPAEDFGKFTSGVMIVDTEGELHLFIVLPNEDVYACSQVRSEDEPIYTRSPEYIKLNDKTIGIVGLGSVGSKIAMSLTRMGCRKFHLIDHDLLLPENLQRHALDWHGIALHKVDAIKAAIGLVAPKAHIEVSRLHLTGQESNAAVSGALSRLAACDVLIDATSNPNVFNLLAAVARTATLPLIWMEVFAGGVGGLVARSRPYTDPTPQDMRGAYHQYCTDNPVPILGSVPNNYTVETEEGEVLVASDADVSIIADHAVRLVSDCFTPPESSSFPCSMYLIGLAKGWVFEAPFATIPISMESYSLEGWDNGKKQKFEPEDIQFLCDLLEKDDDATSNNS